MSEISSIINRAMKEKGVTQKELAELLGVSQPSVNKWISGKGFPTADKFVEIVKYLDIVSEFFPGYRKINREEDSEVDLMRRELAALRKDMGIVKKELNIFDKLKLGEN